MNFNTVILTLPIWNIFSSQNYSIGETIIKNDSLSLYADIFIPENPNLRKQVLHTADKEGNFYLSYPMVDQNGIYVVYMVKIGLTLH